jgi:uncharacterized protein (TIGR02217 family)
MMSFINEVLPDTFAQGSSFGRGFDTKIVSLDNRAEYRLPRNATGQRRYTINLNVWGTDELYELYKFYVAVARGSLNSFLMKDWFDYASTTSGTLVYQSTTAFDQPTEQRDTTEWHIRKAYTFGGEQLLQAVPHIVPDSVKVSINGTEYGPGTYYVVDDLAGVIFTSVPPGETSVASVRCGYEHYVRVRFETDVDQLFQIAIHGTDTAELPNVSLIEDLTDYDWSQDWPMGGAREQTLTAINRPRLSQLYGRLWYCTPTGSGQGVELPSLTTPTAKAGGPHFMVFNASVSFSMNIYNDGGTIVKTILPDSGCELWIANHPSAGLTWVCAS